MPLILALLLALAGARAAHAGCVSGPGYPCLTATVPPVLLQLGTGQDVSPAYPLPVTIGSGSIDTQGQLRVAARPGISTPAGPLASTIATGGVAVTVFAAGSMTNVIDIINPPSATETLYVDIVATALAGAPTSIPLVPGQAYRVSGPISTAVTAVAATAGHAFVAVSY